MYLYNSLSRKKEKFVPNHPDVVKMYTCGPTVYHYAHIGNLRTYIMEDVLEKALRYEGYNVKRVMNITDVGHLASDADTGEDKMLKGAKRENKSVMDIAKFYTDAFFADCDKLNITAVAGTCIDMEDPGALAHALVNQILNHCNVPPLQAKPDQNRTDSGQTGHHSPVELEYLLHLEAGADGVGEAHGDKGDHQAQSHHDEDVHHQNAGGQAAAADWYHDGIDVRILFQNFHNGKIRHRAVCHINPCVGLQFGNGVLGSIFPCPLQDDVTQFQKSAVLLDINRLIIAGI